MIKATHLDEGLEMSNLRSIVLRGSNLLSIAIVLSLTACGNSEAEDAAAQTPTVDPRFATAESLIEYYNTIDKTSPEYLSQSLDLYYAETPLQEKISRFFHSAVTHVELLNELKDYFGEAHDRYSWEEVLGEPMPTDIKETPLPPKWPPASITEHSGDRAKAVQKGPYQGAETMHLVKVGTRWWISGYTWEYERLEDVLEESLDELLVHNEKEASAGQQLRPRLLPGEFKTPRAYYDELYRLMGEPPPHARR